MNSDDLRARDHEARRAAQTVFDRPLVLEAGAGTGKTTTLIARLLVWTLGPGWESAREHAADDDAIASRVLSRVVAITFTEAASAEMAERMARALALVMRGERPVGVHEDALALDAERSRRARALLGNVDRLVVRTIHAWCRRLLASHPLEANVHPDFSVDADGTLVAQVVREVVEARLREAYAEPGDPWFLQLAAWRYGPREIEETLARAVETGLPLEALRDDPFAPERCRDLLVGARAALARFRDIAGERLAAVGARATRTHAADGAVRTLLARIDATPHTRAGLQALAEQVRELYDEPVRAKLGDWAKSRFGKQEASLLGERAPELVPAARDARELMRRLAALEPERLEAGRRVLEPLLSEARRELRARGIATFGSLLRDTRRLLAEHPEVRERVARGLDQLVVDEFQDTDATQCEIVRLLALDGERASSPGLFIVGDPKQSIYGWRQADLKAYEEFVERLEAAGGARHVLSVNYRSGPGILDEVNRLLAPVMLRAPGLQPAYEPLVPADPSAQSTTEHWLVWGRDPETGDPREERALEGCELEARAVARDIRAVHDAGTPWSEIAVLMRSRSDLETYLEALRAAGVPFAVEGDRSYYQRREVIDLGALVRAVVDPNDHLSLVTWLRSPVVGIPDAAWIPLWARRFPERMTALGAPDPAALQALDEMLREVAEDLPALPGLERIAGWEHSASAAIETLAVLRESFEREAPDQFVETLRTRTLLEATEAARYLGRYRVANLERFLRRLVNELCGAGSDAAALLRALRRRIREAEEEEEASPKDGGNDAVQVRTIHQAKGLDFEQVYLVQAHKRAGGFEDTEARFGTGEAAVEFSIFGAATPGFGQVLEQRAAVARAEQVRTLYVALTRAKRRLVISAQWPLAGDPPVPDAATSHLDLLRWREGSHPDARALWDDLVVAGAERHSDGPVAWRFPVLAHDIDAAPPAPVAAPDLPPIARASGDARRIEIRRAAAREHSERPFRGRASDDAREPFDERRRAGEVARPLATAVGSAMHAVLERFEAGLPAKREIARALEHLPEEIARQADPAERGAALALARALLERFWSGPLFPRLRALGGDVAREVPVLVPPGDPPGNGGATGYVSGVIDLLYRDAETGDWVVADYKTDRVSGEDEIAGLAGRYSAQGSVYTRAIRSALALPEEPRFELWLLYAGRVLVVDPVQSPVP